MMLFVSLRAWRLMHSTDGYRGSWSRLRIVVTCDSPRATLKYLTNARMIPLLPRRVRINAVVQSAEWEQKNYSKRRSLSRSDSAEGHRGAVCLGYPVLPETLGVSSETALRTTLRRHR